MPWEESYCRTLYIERRGKQYQLQGLCQICTPDGNTYMEPLPSDGFSLRGMCFDKVEIIDAPGTGRGDDASELSLCHIAQCEETLGRTA